MRITKMKTVQVPGIIHKFQLELFLKNKNKSEMEICLGLIAFNETTKQKRITNLPLHALPWLRKQMVEMLVRHDGTEAILCDAPAQIPQQFFLKDAFPAPSAVQKLHQKETMTQNINKKSSFVQQYPTIQNYNNKSGDKKQTMPVHFDTQQMDVFHAPIVQNSNPSCHKLDHIGMQPQFANKKTASFQQYPKIASKIQNSNQNDIKNQKLFTSLPIHQRPNLKQSAEVKKSAKNNNEHLDPQMAELEEGIRALFDFDDREMEKYRI